jgi:uncharacterized membrane protein (GlpM family)
MPNAFIIVKVLVSALIIVAISEIAKRNTAFAALVASLPLLSLLAVLWMVAEGADNTRVADHMEATFWYVLPTLPMFLLVPVMLRHGVSFALSLVAGIGLTIVLYVGIRRLAAVFGVIL